MNKRVLSVALGALALGSVVQAQVISEVRFRESGTTSPEFVELYNPGTTPIDVAGWKLQYKSSTGTVWSDKVTIGAGAVLQPKKFMLLGGLAMTPAPDFVSGTALGLGNSGGQVRIIDASTNQIDLVGWIAANSAEGAAPAPSHAAGGSLERKANAASTATTMAPSGIDNLLGNGYDSNNNLADFVVHDLLANTSPQNSSSAQEPVVGNVAPLIGTVSYSPNPLLPGSLVVFTANITDTDGVVASANLLYGTTPGSLTSSATLFATTPGVFTTTDIITAPAACQTLYYKVQATDDFGDSSQSGEMSAPVQCLVTIAQIQGGAASSPYAGMTVTTEGQVTYLHNSSSMFIQDGNGAWNGVQIFGSHPGVLEGDLIRVTGSVLEFSGFTEIAGTPVIQVLASPGTLAIEPTEITIAQALQEDYESVLVRVLNNTCVSSVDPNSYFFDGTEQILVYRPGFTGIEDACYDMTGVRYSYQSTPEILPRTVADITECAVVDAGDVVNSFSLGQAWPNPFNPTAEIRFSLDRSAQARLVVHNVLGQEVAVLVDGVVAEGTHTARFDAAALPSGLYLYTLQSEGRQLSGRMLLVR